MITTTWTRMTTKMMITTTTRMISNKLISDFSGFHRPDVHSNYVVQQRQSGELDRQNHHHQVNVGTCSPAGCYNGIYKYMQRRKRPCINKKCPPQNK